MFGEGYKGMQKVYMYSFSEKKFSSKKDELCFLSFSMKQNVRAGGYELNQFK